MKHSAVSCRLVDARNYTVFDEEGDIAITPGSRPVMVLAFVILTRA
jgi:hypothetical protein